MKLGEYATKTSAVALVRRRSRHGVRHRSQRQHTPRGRRRRHAAALGVARRARDDRHEVRLWHSAMRRLHRAYRRQSRPVVSPCDRYDRRQSRYHDRGRWRDAGRRESAAGVARPGSYSMRLLPVGPDHVGGGAAREQSAARSIPTSMRQWRETSAAAAPTCASAKRSSTLRARLRRRPCSQKQISWLLPRVAPF